MDLTSGSLFWPTTCLRMPEAAPLRADTRCDVLVVGAGITGALMAVELARAGLGVVVVDRRRVAAGSTSASTALIQYEIDTPLVELTELLGAAHAEGAYRASRRAIDGLAELIATLDDPSECTRRRSLFLATEPEDVDLLRREHNARAKIGIDVEYLDEQTLRQVFNISRPGALLCDVAYELNPVRVTNALFRHAKTLGARIYEQTELELEPYTGSMHRARTTAGHVIRAEHVVLASGYETPEQFMAVRSLTTLKSTYAIAGTPSQSGLWPGNVLVWESGDPYTYMRTTNDGRVIIGGEDNELVDPDERDALIATNTDRLVKKAARLVEGLDITPAFAWAGTFAQTDDSLPLIGALGQWPAVHFALGYGGNGISFSYIAAQIIRDAITHRPSTDAQYFSFEQALKRRQWTESDLLAANPR